MKHIQKPMLRLSAVLVSAAMAMIVSCKPNTADASKKDGEADLNTPAKFDSDSAYAYVERQVAFGPRIPGTAASDSCANYIMSELTRHGAKKVRAQEAEVTAYNGDRLPIRNIMASFNTKASKRILLLAHYDTRPWADSDENEDLRSEPVPGANDGASGVGVMLEIARHLGKLKPGVGVDMLFVDAEDYGQSSGFSNHDSSWALGTQYWVNHMPYSTDSLPRYAILFDMVGGTDAKFHREYFSDRHAPEIVDKVWSIAENSGFGDKFVNMAGGAVIDDHVFLNDAGIPSIDIIESKNDRTKSFPSTWHTTADDMTAIDRYSLKAAGQTVLNVIYNE